MGRFLKAAGGILLFLTACSTMKYSTSDFKVTREVLSNGLTVILVEDHDYSVVSYNTFYRVGSVYEREGKTGIAHLFEHLMFKGTEKFPGQPFFDLLESKGAVVNAETGRELTSYYQIISSKDLPKVIELEADRMRNIKLDPAKLEAEKKVVLEERRMRLETDFTVQLINELESIVYPNHPYGVPVIGYADDISGLTIDDCQKFYNEYYQPKNAIISIVGDFDGKKTMEDIKRFYGSIASHDLLPPTSHVLKDLDGEIRKTIYRPIASSTIAIAYRIPALSNEDMTPLSVLADAAFNLDSSRGRQVLIREKQVSVGLQTSLMTGKEPGIFLIMLPLHAGFPAELALKEFDDFIADLRATPLSDKEFARVKNRIEVNMLTHLKSASTISSLLTMGEFYFNDHNKMLDRYLSWHNVTKGDVMRVARVWLRPENRVVVTMRPKAERE